MFQRCFQSVSKVSLGSFKKLSRCFKKVSCCMALIAASRAEGGLVFEKLKLSDYQLTKTMTSCCGSFAACDITSVIHSVLVFLIFVFEFLFLNFFFFECED